MTGIGFAAQVTENGGAGSWVTGSSALGTLVIFFIALFSGSKTFAVFDWLSLAGALGAMLLWAITKDPMLAVILITLTDALGFLPTIRKGWFYPYEETVSMFALSSFKFILGLLALESFTLTTWLYPISLVAMNGAFAIMLLIRRQALLQPTSIRST